VALLACAVESHAVVPLIRVGATAVDEYLLPAGPSPANPPHTMAQDGTDRQTDTV